MSPELCCSLDLMIEGDGDEAAVPDLIRRVANTKGQYGIVINSGPIQRLSVPRLLPIGKIETYIEYAMRKDGNSILIAIDADESCPLEVSSALSPRIASKAQGKSAGLCLFRSEYEVLFIYCLDFIADKYPEFGWNLDGWRPDDGHENIRDAKGYLSRRMRSGKSYKPTRDQTRFNSALDFDRLRQCCRSFRHFESTLEQLIEHAALGTTCVVPKII